MPVIEQSVREGANFRGLRVARGDYSFAVDGGAVGTIALAGATFIPAGAIVLAAFLEVDTVPTSGGAPTIAVQVESAGDIQSAAAISGAPWSTTGHKLASKTFATAPVETTAARDISIVIATAALTAGIFKVYVIYLDPLG